MMKNFILSIILLISCHSNAQDKYNKWSLSYALGSHFWTKPSSPKADLKNLQVSHHELNGRYMFNNRLGVMLGLRYDFFDFKGLGKRNTHYISTAVQGVVNVGDIIKLHSIHERLGLLLHVGGGYSVMWQTYPKRSANDNMIHVTAGLTPQLRLTDRWSLRLDATMNANYKQNVTYDFLRKLSTKNTLNYTGIFFNVSLGVTYYIGKNKTHADWTPTVYGLNTPSVSTDLGPLEKRIQQLEEQLKDDDNDGVVNGRDLEPNTRAGVVVNSLGQEVSLPLDTDGDGFADKVDKCPTEFGTINGCPDSDYDGIPDNDDDCPNNYGKPENRGCPVAKETMIIIQKISETTYFNTGEAILKQESFSGLDKLANILKENADVVVFVEGHTDNQGDDAFNLQLSKERAAVVKTYLISKGLSSDRIVSEGYGKTQPIADNNTEEGRAKNRRVEIEVSTKK